MLTTTNNNNNNEISLVDPGHNIVMLTRDFIPHSSSNIRQTVINRFMFNNVIC